MKKLATYGALLITAALIVACEPRVSASSPQDLQASIDRMMEKMTPEERDQFSLSLQAVVFDGANIGADGVMGTAAPSGLVLLSAADKIKGKTADQIIELGYQTQIRHLDEQIAKGLKIVQSAQAERERHRATFENIRIEGARFYIDGRWISEPVIEFRITNDSNDALRRAYFHGTLTSEGRTIPWVDEPFNHEFSGGLEAGESRFLRLNPNMFSEWGQGDHINRKDLKLSVALVNIEDSNSQKLLTGQPDDPAALQREMALLQAEKTKLEAEFASL